MVIIISPVLGDENQPPSQNYYHKDELGEKNHGFIVGLDHFINCQ